jgi:hypothetical protein
MDIKAYVEDRDKTMLTHDPKEVKAFAERWKDIMHPEMYKMLMEQMADKTIIATTHKAVVAITNMSEEEKAKSIKWLEENDFGVGI